jgi:hypothetical protein
MDRFGLAHRISHKQDRLLDRLRDRRTDAATGLPGTADSFAALIGEEFALLVTFRRSGGTRVAADPALPNDAAERTRTGVRDACEANGSSAGMAAFIAMMPWPGEFTDEHFALSGADPVAVGMATDGRRLAADPTREHVRRVLCS